MAVSRRIVWLNVITVISAAILIGAEVFGAAFAAGWAFANLFGFSEYVVIATKENVLIIRGMHILQGLFFVLGVAVMISFIRNAKRVEPFISGR